MQHVQCPDCGKKTVVPKTAQQIAVELLHRSGRGVVLHTDRSYRPLVAQRTAGDEARVSISLAYDPWTKAMRGEDDSPEAPKAAALVMEAIADLLIRDLSEH